ncbi:MAG: hypothetical protein NUW02_02145 [Candidatus Campbellbacteria bacterium]|nr:hypothetical protein [Candidatus Campbellbacteria bacterium]
MSHKSFISITTFIFAVIGILHLMRVLYAWNAVIAGWMVPMWLSWLAVLACALLVWSGLKLRRH